MAFAQHHRQFAAHAALLMLVACSGGDATAPPSPPGPPPTGRLAGSAQTPAGPLYVGEPAVFTFAGTAFDGATVDSIVVPLGVPRVLGPTGASAIAVLEGPRIVPFTVWGRNSAGMPLSVSGSVVYTGARRPSAVRLMIRPLGVGTAFAGSLSRVDVVVNGQLLNVPTDTTIERTGPTFTLGVPATQPAAYTYGELVLDTLWRPLAPNLRTHTLPLSGDVAVELALLSKAGFGAADKVEFDLIWTDRFDGTVHPTRIRNWEVWILENPTGVYTSSCRSIPQAERDAVIARIEQLRVEDASGPDGQRRTYNYRAGDPVAAGRLVPNGPGWKPAPGVVLYCKSVPGGQSNPMFYDALGFLESAWVFAGGIDPAGWASEDKGLSDMVRFGQEGESAASRHSRGLGSITRKSLDAFVYDHIMRIAWRAGQHGFGLLRGPQ